MTTKVSSVSPLRTYYQLTKPGIIRGNAMTAAAGFFLAAQGHIRWLLLLAVLAGTSLVIASACVLNNVIDRDIDSRMKRTQKRALVSGAVSVRNAMFYAVILGIVGFAILLLFTNALTAAIGLVGIVSYVIIYGYAKRQTVYSTLIGSIAGAVPPVAGYTAVTNQLDAGALILFIILTFWQMPHFYAIALYRKDEYAAAKLPIWSVRRGERSTQLQIILFTALFVGATMVLTLAGYTGAIYTIVMAAIGLYWLYLGVEGYREGQTNITRWARGMFGLSLVIILVFSVLISVDHFLP